MTAAGAAAHGGTVRRIAYLGPDGSFASEAARRASHKPASLQPMPTVVDVVEAVRAGECDWGVVPMENSVEGSVNVTLDELAFGAAGVYIRAEITMPVTMNLLGRPDADLTDITVVRSHSHALAQSRGWLAAHLPQARQEAVTSTAEAARQVGADPTLAAIGTTAAASRFGLSIIVADIGDHIDTATRFVVLGNRFAAATGSDKTSMVVFFGNDRPGQLVQVLNEFAMRSINLTKIESRPTKKQLGEYCIFIDCLGHASEPRVGEALRSVHRHVAELRVLGSYARSVGHSETTSSSDSAVAYAESADWYAAILQHTDDGG
jgi:prephenate dehydratase